MRALVLVLMIALLPVRGWVGDAMATQLALPSAGAQVHASSTAHPDCALHGSSTQAQDDDADQGGCSLCQICHTVAMEIPLITLAPVALQGFMAPLAACSFVSAERALSVKPPIV